MRGRLNLRRERGASLVMFALSLPVLFGFFAFVVDTGNAFGVKRATQNAADAAALAAVQEITSERIAELDACGGDTVCYEASSSTYRGDIEQIVLTYSQKNGSDLTEVVRCDSGSGVERDCYTWPYRPAAGGECEGSPAPEDEQVADYLRLEVCLEDRTDAFFARFFGIEAFDPAARAVAVVQAEFEPECVPTTPDDADIECTAVSGECVDDVPPTESGDHDRCSATEAVPPQQGLLVVGEEAHCVFAENEDDDPDNDIEDPDQYLGTSPPCRVVQSGEGGVGGAQGFAMSRACNAILYTGTPETANNPFPVLGAFATNGGLTFTGRAGKRLDKLGFDQARCGHLLPQPPSGDPATCDAAATRSRNPESCVRNLIDFGDSIPLNWPVTPPVPPTPLPPGTVWDPAVHYPRHCVLLSPPPDSTTVTVNVAPGPPGIYCVSGPETVLLINNDMTAGDGYTFFALDGARIEVASNGTDVRFYWPSACPSPDTGVVGERPTTRTLSFVCFGRRIVGYDPLTLLYSSRSTAFPSLCEEAAICIRGQGGSIEGDIFAPEPRALAPPASLTQGGGTVWIAGGGASAGNGFIEAWQITIQGNSATYTGTGPLVGGPATVVTQGELVLGEDATCFFSPPVADPEQYVGTDPPCYYEGQPATAWEWLDTTEYGRLETTVVVEGVGMDE